MSNPRNLFDPFVNAFLEEEKKNYDESMVPWSQHEEEIRLAYAQISDTVFQRLTHALELINEKFDHK